MTLLRAMTRQDHLITRKPKRCREHDAKQRTTGDARTAIQTDLATKNKRESNGDDDNDADHHCEHHICLRETAIDRECDHNAKPCDIAKTPWLAIHKYGKREHPARPGHNITQRPSQPACKGTGEHERHTGKKCTYAFEIEHAGKHIGASSREGELDIDNHKERELQREEVADNVREAQHRRLEVQEKWHSKKVVVVPQRELTVVNHLPVKRVPRDHLTHRVAIERTVDRME